MILSICDLPDVLKVMRIVDIIIAIIRIVVPILLIVSAMIELVKAVTNAELNKISKPMINKVIAAVLIFFIPLFVKLIANIAGYSSEYENCLSNVTTETIATAYGKQEEIFVKRAEETLKESDYKYALAYLNKVTDEELKNNFTERLKIVKEKMEVPIITSIKNDGVIVTVKAKGINSGITGYYFSYNDTKPEKGAGGYLATNLKSIDVVRLPGATYVWAEDEKGRISKPARISLKTSVIPFTGGGYGIIQGPKLRDYMKERGWPIEELNKLMARSVRAAGLHTKEGAATAGVTLAVVLIQKFGVKIPYWRGGKTGTIGAYGAWGMYRPNPTYKDGGYDYYGMDCDGFVNWTFKNTGFDSGSILGNSYYYWPGIEFKKSNGEPGDVLRTKGHVALIVGKTKDYFIVAEEAGVSSGLIISQYSYSTTNYQIIKGEKLTSTYQKIPDSEYPTGF